MDRNTPPEADWKERAVGGLIDQVGPLWTRRETAGWAYGIVATSAATNPAGLVHGGLVTTLADHALSAIAWEAAERTACVTVQMDTHFLAAAKPGDFLEARARVARKTRSIVFLEGSVSVADTEIALVTGVWKISGAPSAAS